ncbi:MAG: helix-turn-helix domain-containing protein [Nitrososphaerales archaeon]
MRGTLTMEEFGQLHGVTKQMISFWEMGRSQPRPEMLKRMGIRISYSVDIE